MPRFFLQGGGLGCIALQSPKISRFTSKFPPMVPRPLLDRFPGPPTRSQISRCLYSLLPVLLANLSPKPDQQSFNMASAKKTKMSKAESLERAKKWAVERRNSKSSASTIKASSASRKRNTRASATEFPTAKKTPTSTDRAEIRERARASVQRKSKKPQCDAEETTRPTPAEEVAEETTNTVPAEEVPVVVVQTNNVNVVEDSGLEDFQTACAGTQAETGTVVNESDVEELNRLKQDVGNAFHRLEVFCEKMVTKETGGDAMDCD